MAPVREYSWEEMIALTHRLADELLAADIRPDSLIWVLRGGAFPGLLLSHLLGVRDCHAIRVASTVDDTARAARHPTPQVSGPLADIAGRHVLVVDDIINTGRTLRAVIAAVSERRPRQITSACLVWDTVPLEGDEPIGQCEADFHVDAVHAWVGVPWEAEAKGVRSIGGTGSSAAQPSDENGGLAT